MRRCFSALALALPILAWLAEPARPAADPPPSDSVFQPVGPPRQVFPELVLSELYRLTGVTSAGDDRLFLTQQHGIVHVVRDGEVLSPPFLDLQPIVGQGSERGLLSLAFHPRYAANGSFFVQYTDVEGAVVVARYQVSQDDPDRADPESGRIVIRIAKPFGNHNGGQLQFGPDGYLYVSIGDGVEGGDPTCLAQQGTTLLGKMLRLDVDRSTPATPGYAIPADNPFRAGGNPGGTGGMPPEVWAYGLRNPWRYSFDRKTGDLYIGDVGEDRREEINLQPAGTPGGQNYGWRVMEGTLCFSSTGCPADTPPCGSSRYTPPILEYEHIDQRCSVAGGYVYRGTLLPHLYGAYVFGDTCNGQLWSAIRKGGSWEVRPLAAPRVLYVTSFGEDRNGEIYLTSLDGRLLRLAARHPVDTVGLYDPALSRFLLKDLHLSGDDSREVPFGPRGAGWLPVAGDWDGDGHTTVGLYEPKKAQFHMKTSFAAGSYEVVVKMQLSGKTSRVVPIAGDWDGDGRDTIGFYNRSNSTFQLENTHTGGPIDLSFRFGSPSKSALPVAGDWDGDGRDTVGLYDPVRGLFRLTNRLDGSGDIQISYGPRGKAWLPLAGDWDGDGRDGIGLYAPSSAVFLLRNTPQAGPADHEIRFGPAGAGWMPVAGDW